MFNVNNHLCAILIKPRMGKALCGQIMKPAFPKGTYKSFKYVKILNFFLGNSLFRKWRLRDFDMWGNNTSIERAPKNVMIN